MSKTFKFYFFKSLNYRHKKNNRPLVSGIVKKFPQQRKNAIEHVYIVGNAVAIKSIIFFNVK